MFLNKKVFEIINQDEAIIENFNYNSIKDLIIKLIVVLPTGSALISSQNCDKISSGIKLDDLFIGSNATNGIVAEACLKIVPLKK